MSERPTIASAIARADAAHQKIEDHEKLCAERYAAIGATLSEIKNTAAGQSKLLWGVLLSVAGFSLVTLTGIVLRAAHLA